MPAMRYEVAKHRWYGDICPFPEKTYQTRFLTIAWLVAYFWSREPDAAMVRWRSIRQ